MKTVVTHDNLTEAARPQYLDHFEVPQAWCRSEHPLKVSYRGTHEPQVDGYPASPPWCREEGCERLLLLC
jgi:hypothetical protein